MSHAAAEPGPYGLLAEFETPEALLAAARAASKHGFTRMDAYSPMPVDGLAEAIGFTNNRIPMVVLISGILGGAAAYFMLWFSTSVHYPINVGGRPFHSWPAFIPITFEMTILFAAFGAVFGMLGLNGLPRPHHPVFAAKGFERASRDRFFLSIQAVDPLFDREETRRFLETQSPVRVTDVDL